MATQTRVETIILGGGLTGLSSAWHLGTREYLLLERESTFGGLAGTDSCDGYSFDRGSHVWFTTKPCVHEFLCQRQGIDLSDHTRSAWVYMHDTMIPAPFQGNLYGLPKEVISDCLVGYMQAIQNPTAPGDNFGSWLHSRFGDGICRHFMWPYNQKVWTVPPDLLTADLPGARVDVPDARELIEGAIGVQQNALGENAKFAYPVHGGNGAIPAAIAAQLTNITYNAQCERIDILEKGLYLADGTMLRYHTLISTIPLPSLISLIPNAPSHVSSAACQLRSTQVLLVNIALKQRLPHAYHWIYFPESRFPCFRVSFPQNYAESLCPPGGGSLQAECAFPQSAAINADLVAENVVNQLSHAGFFEQSHIHRVTTSLLKPAYVLYDHTRKQNLQLLRDFLHAHQIHTCGRFGAWEYLNMDGCILAGQEAAQWVSSLSTGKG